MNVRVGQGFDIHRLVPGRELRLAGTSIPFDAGLLGHSDGDVVLHAICDSLLGAAGAGDIGTLFPDSDPRHRGADSCGFLLEVSQIVRERGWEIANLHVNIIAERPKLSMHFDSMRRRIAELTGVGEESVSVTARTTEGLGEIGRGEAIAALVVCLLVETAPR